MQPRFVDTNILLRYLVRDNQEQAQRSLNLLLRVERGKEKVYTSSLVIFETVFTLQKFYKVPRQDIAEQLLTIISLRNFHVPEKDIYKRAFNLYISKNIPFGDAYNAAYALEEEQPVVYSWDKDFDKIDGITRVEPE